MPCAGVVGKESEQARERGRDRRVVELDERRQEVQRLLEAGDPRADCRDDRIAPRRLDVVAFVGHEDAGVEPADLGDGAIERRVPAQDERARAPLLVRRLGLAPAMAAGVEDVGQPVLDFGEHRLDEDAAEEPVEHHRVEWLERLRNRGEQRVELGELGVPQVLLGSRDRAARRRRRLGRAHRGRRERQPARRAARRRRTSGSSAGRRWASWRNSSSWSASSPAHASGSTLLTSA